jgi:hypothetical protein
MIPGDLGSAFQKLSQFLDEHPLTAGIAALEHALVGQDSEGVAVVARESAIDAALLQSAQTVRASLGRMSHLTTLPPSSLCFHGCWRPARW